MFKQPHCSAGILVGPVMSRYLTAMSASYVAMGGVAFSLAYVAVTLPESLSPQSRLEVRAVHSVPAGSLKKLLTQWRGRC